jgi:hypothetical protein
MADLYRLVGELTHKNLLSGMSPMPAVAVRILRKLAVEETLPMGALLSNSSRDGKLVILGTQVQAAVIEVLAVKGKYTITISTAAADGDTLKLTVGGVEKTYTANTVSETWQVADIDGDCTALQTLIGADFEDYAVTKTDTTVVLEQKAGRAEEAAVIVVTQADATGALAAVVAENPEGVTYVAPLDVEVLTPAYVLAEDTSVTIDADVNVPVFTAGCFAPENVTVKDGHTRTDAENDALRQRNIVFRSSYHD